ncbi:MAG: hypothetical protein M1818_000567 [Claussenomyces sp. TS43310]|nr:MAG: hypothetical protein M1818_000567 [Claussenomyces sp. TS43310]
MNFWASICNYFQPPVPKEKPALRSPKEIEEPRWLGFTEEDYAKMPPLQIMAFVCTWLAVWDLATRKTCKAWLLQEMESVDLIDLNIHDMWEECYKDMEREDSDLTPEWEDFQSLDWE